MQLRVVQKTGGAASKLAQIKTVRKNIARVLTVYHQKQKDSLREYARQNKYLPTDLRHKRTRAIRRRLSTADVRSRRPPPPPRRASAALTPAFRPQAARKTLRIRKREQNFPMRRFALKASE